VRALLEARVTRIHPHRARRHLPGWANPPSDGSAGGDYPFAFDCPDAAVNDALDLPALVTLQVAAFAQQITVHDSEAAYRAHQATEGTYFDSRSFVPSGLISPSGEPVTPPESHALVAGHVIEAAPRMNSVTGHPYWWALVDTIGGTFDVVVDPPLLTGPIRPGNIVSGWFWLSGRVRRDARPRAGWFRRLTGRG
jgi:hypothetical protein